MSGQNVFGDELKILPRNLHVCMSVAPSSEIVDVTRETGQGIKLSLVLVLSWSVKSF